MKKNENKDLLQIMVTLFPNDFTLNNPRDVYEKLLSTGNFLNEKSFLYDFLPSEAPPEIPRFILTLENQKENSSTVIELSFQKISIIQKKLNLLEDFKKDLSKVEELIGILFDQISNLQSFNRVGYIRQYLLVGKANEIIKEQLLPKGTSELTNFEMAFTFEHNDFTLYKKCNHVLKLAQAEFISKPNTNESGLVNGLAIESDFNTHQSLKLNLKLHDVLSFIKSADEFIQREKIIKIATK